MATVGRKIEKGIWTDGLAYGLYRAPALPGAHMLVSWHRNLSHLRNNFLCLKFGIWKNTIGKMLEKPEGAEGDITPFQALATALAATIGTGNIAGVATAIATGGPGAVFWMWFSAFFGMVTKFGEVVLAVRYREQKPDGSWAGGPITFPRSG